MVSIFLDAKRRLFRVWIKFEELTLLIALPSEHPLPSYRSVRATLCSVTAIILGKQTPSDSTERLCLGASSLGPSLVPLFTQFSCFAGFSCTVSVYNDRNQIAGWRGGLSVHSLRPEGKTRHSCMNSATPETTSSFETLLWYKNVFSLRVCRPIRLTKCICRYLQVSQVSHAFFYVDEEYNKEAESTFAPSSPISFSRLLSLTFITFTHSHSRLHHASHHPRHHRRFPLTTYTKWGHTHLHLPERTNFGDITE